MRNFDVWRRALAFGCSAATLVGCSSPQQPGVSSVIPQTLARSRVEEAALRTQVSSKKKLLYIVTDANLAYVVKYPSGDLAQRLTFASSGTGSGACTASSGNVFITAWNNTPSTVGFIYEFVHGGTSPISALQESGYTPTGCSVDPTNGNLAVSNNADGNCFPGGNVAIYPGAKGPPTTYTVSGFECYSTVAYDSSGDLFVGGKGYGSGSPFELAELPKGSSNFATLTLSKQITCPGECNNHLQWDGSHLAITQPTANHKSPLVYKVDVSGSNAEVVGTVTFRGSWGKYSGQASLIQGDNIIMDYRPGSVAMWAYPRGGKLVKVLIQGLEHLGKPGMAMSV